MRLIEAWNRRPQDDLSGVSSPGTVTRLSGTARLRLPSVAAAGLWPVPWEPSLQWELKWELRRLPDSFHAARSSCSKFAHDLDESCYGIEP